jgi:hypothetical protein
LSIFGRSIARELKGRPGSDYCFVCGAGIADRCSFAVKRAFPKEYRPMSLLPRVTEKTRELVAREFDARGPDVCMSEIIEHLEQHNPELLDMAAKWAADLGNPAKAMLGFGMFYRLLIPAPPGTGVLSPLPRVSEETRARLVREIDHKGPADFTLEAIAELEERNPELLQMAHNFASGLGNYLHAMQGFALLYRSLVMQSWAERARPH